MGEDRHGLGKSQGKRADTAEQIRDAAGAVAGGAHPAGELDLPLRRSQSMPVAVAVSWASIDLKRPATDASAATMAGATRKAGTATGQAS
jgi:hypothetical protein